MPTKYIKREEKRDLLYSMFCAIAMLVDAEMLWRLEPIGWNNKHELALVARAAQLTGLDYQETREILSKAYTEARKRRK
jgi:hypothetical protein